MWVIEFVGKDNIIHKKYFKNELDAEFFKLTHCGIYNKYYEEEKENDEYE